LPQDWRKVLSQGEIWLTNRKERAGLSGHFPGWRRVMKAVDKVKIETPFTRSISKQGTFRRAGLYCVKSPIQHLWLLGVVQGEWSSESSQTCMLSLSSMYSCGHLSYPAWPLCCCCTLPRDRHTRNMALQHPWVYSGF